MKRVREFKYQKTKDFKYEEFIALSTCICIITVLCIGTNFMRGDRC